MPTLGTEALIKKAIEGDREYLVVGRLTKSQPGPDAPFDGLDLWLDPGPEEEPRPHASARSSASIAAVRWIGLATGAETRCGVDT